MFSSLFSLAAKNLKHRGIRSWLTLLGIIIGIAAVVALISLGQGLENAITGQFSSISADRLVVTNAETGFGPPGSTAVKKLTENDEKIISEVQGVTQVIPRLVRITKVEYNKVARFEFTGSLPKKQEYVDFIYTTFQLKAAEGTLLEASNRGEVMLGSDVAKEERFGKEIRVGTSIEIQGKPFKVAAILEPLSNFQFNNAIFMPEDDMKEVLNIKDESDLLIIKVDNPEHMQEIADEITRKLRKDRHEKEGEEDFSVQTPTQVFAAVTTILDVIKIVVGGIAAISLLIGVIGVANTMFTSVLERTKEIGVMKAIGARRRNILAIFLIESSFLGLVGGILGAIIGISIAFLAAHFANTALGSSLLLVTISWHLTLSSVALALILGIIAGTVPAMQASRLHPVEALRK